MLRLVNLLFGSAYSTFMTNSSVCNFPTIPLTAFVDGAPALTVAFCDHKKLESVEPEGFINDKIEPGSKVSIKSGTTNTVKVLS